MLGDDVGGIAVSVGTRIGARAAPGEVFVSSTVKDPSPGPASPSRVPRARAEGRPRRWHLFGMMRAREPDQTRQRGSRLILDFDLWHQKGLSRT
jgi:hypothetical protein